MKRMFLSIVFTVLCCLGTAAGARELIGEFSGDASDVTGEFDAHSPWIVDWRVSSDYRSGATVEVSLLDATGKHIGYVLNTTGTGNGVKLFEQSGRFYFRVNANLVHWSLKVEQLSDEEASLYTPKLTGAPE